MKYIAVFVVTILVLVHGDSTREEGERAHYECQADPATKIGEGASPNEYAAHTLCVGVKLGTLEPNGDVNLKGLRKFVGRMPDIDAAKIDKIVANCGKRHGASAEQTAMGLIGCLTKWSAT